MKLQFFFCLPISRFNSLEKRFGEFKNRLKWSSKYSRFFDRRSWQTRFLSFVYLVFFRRSAISLVSVKRKISSDYDLLYIFVEPIFICFGKLFFHWKWKRWRLFWVHQPDFRLTYRSPVINLTAPDNALDSLGISLYDTHFEEMKMCPGLLKPNGLRSCYYQMDISGIMICNIGFDDTKLKIA